MARVIAIGDIHGCKRELVLLLDQINPTADDLLVFLGDYIDRGPDSKGVVDELLALQDRCQTVFIKGNHEEMMEFAQLGKDDFKSWLKYGGRAALKSYGINDFFDHRAVGGLISSSHRSFYTSLKQYHETDSHIFVHANYNPQLDLADHDGQTLRWEHMDFLKPPHKSGKTVVVGHSIRAEVMNLGHVICVDTGAGFSGGKLSAIDLTSWPGIVYSEACEGLDARGVP